MAGPDGCLACELSQGVRELPGGLIHATEYWRVEHCVGPLGVGTLIVKPVRHVEHVAELTSDEAGELGPLLRLTSAVVNDICRPQQVYVCLWSHGPTHIHFVVQPETDEAMRAHGAYGPDLQMAMFADGAAPDPIRVAEVAVVARGIFARRIAASMQ